MAALPLLDQTANEPLLNNSIEQHTDNLTLESSQPSQNDLKSSEGKPNDEIRLLFPDDRFWSIASIVVGFVVAVALAVSHHAYLQYLRGRNIEEFPQVWIKGANNGFSNIFSIFVGLSAGAALTQIKWRASGSEPLRMHTIDNLFALPAPLALLKTLIRPRGSLFFPIISSVLIQALVLVSALAPGALTVGLSEQVTRAIEVPIFNLSSQSQFSRWWVNGTYYPSGELVLAYFNLTAMGEHTINSVLLNLPEFTWTIPQDCGLKCAFHFEYNAPGLECHDTFGGFPSPASVYQANTTMAPFNVNKSPSQQIDTPYDLSINYALFPGVENGNLPDSRGATNCRFYQATYNASFQLNSNSSTQQATTSLISHGDYLSSGKTAAVATSLNELEDTVASWVISYTFALAFLSGPIGLGEVGWISQTNPVLVPIFKINAADDLFELAVSNLSQHLVDLFSNLTLGLLSTRGGQDPVIANATTWDGSSVWIYTPWTLWATYLPAVILAIVVALYGLYTIHLSGIAMDDGFSSFLLATQNAELSEMCKKAAAFDELQRLQLIHEKNGTFVLIDSTLKSPN